MGFVIDNLYWYVPVVAAYIVWPLLRKRRAYVVLAAILFLTPMLGLAPMPDLVPGTKNFGLWPLAFAIPTYFGMGFEDFLSNVLPLTLPFATFVGLVAWLMARQFMSPFPSNGTTSRADAARLGQTGAKKKAWLWTFGSARHVWLLRLLLRFSVLPLLLIAVTAYLKLCEWVYKLIF